MLKRVLNIKSGIVLALFSVLFFSIMGIFVKLASQTIPSTEISFFRGAVGTLIIVPYMLYNHFPISVGNKRLLVVRGLLGGLAVLFSFYAISRLKLSESSILTQTIPVFVVIFARFFLKEKLPNAFYFVLAASVIGALLVIKPSIHSLGSFPAFVALLAAITSALAYVCIRSLRKDHDTHIVVFYFIITATIVPIPFMLKGFVVPNLVTSFYLLIIGVSATIGQFFMTKAYGVEKAGLVSMVNYTGIILNIFWDLIIWGVILDTASMIGGLLIIASSIILTLKQYAGSPVPNVPSS